MSLSGLENSPASTGPETPGSPERTLRSGPAFAIDEPVSVVSPLVFASPHSGRIYPEPFSALCRLPLMDLRRVEDAYVDRLLSEAPEAGAPVIRGLVGRAYVDLNRAETEIDPDMFHDPDPEWRRLVSPRVEAGLGCIPRVAHNGAAIYDAPLSRSEAQHRLDTVYRPYHRALDSLLARSESMFGTAWLIDCHSMPSEADRVKTPEIVLGDRFGSACPPRLMSFVEAFFRSRGYSTARNHPYSGGYATIKHGRIIGRRHALQIEIRRDLYLDEATVEPHQGLVKLRSDLADLSREATDMVRQTAGLGPIGERKRPRRMPTRPRS